MGCQELIDSLYRAADERTRLIWQEAEKDALKIREANREKIMRMREDSLKHGVSREEADRIIALASSEARSIALSSEKKLSERLFKLALSNLHALRKEKYRDIFASLVNELPPLSWEEVTVNPADRDIAEELFPGAKIFTDAGITGGFDAIVGNGRIRVINTFEKRLERAWTEIIPALIKGVYNELSSEASASGS